MHVVLKQKRESSSPGVEQRIMTRNVRLKVVSVMYNYSLNVIKVAYENHELVLSKSVDKGEFGCRDGIGEMVNTTPSRGFRGTLQRSHCDAQIWVA